MRVLLSIIFLTSLNSCTKVVSDDPTATIPVCVENFIEENSEELYSVRRQFIDGEYHYWLNTGDIAFDGSEDIVNGECEDVCMFCGNCIPAECTEVYDLDGWATIWGESE